MLSIYQLKPKFQAALRPVVNWIAAKGGTANQITILALVFSLATAAGLILYANVAALWLLAPMLLVRMALNAIDGILAKEHEQKSDLGAFLNEVADVVSDAALIAALIIVPGISIVALALFGFVAVLTEFVGVMGATVASQRQYQGPMGKSDRAFFISVFAILVSVFPSAAALINPILIIATLLAALTVMNRVKAALSNEQ